jgi:predicted deacylase
MTDEFETAFAAAAPGTRFRARIPFGSTASGAALAIPVTGIRGPEGGPCLWINGNVHGDELNGLLAAFDFINGLDPAALRGSVVLSTSGNPLAMDARVKKSPLDEEDLDQAFPGRTDGFPTERMAAALFNAILAAQATVTVNMHTHGTRYDSAPYGVYKLHPEARVGEQELLRMTAHFRPMATCRMAVQAGQGELPGNIAGALDYQLLARGRTAFRIEQGGGGRAEPAFIEQAAAGYRSLAAEMGILPERPAPLPATLRRVTARGHVTSDHGGFARQVARIGTVVPAGSPLMRLCNAYGDPLPLVTLPRDVFVLGLRRDPIVHTGDRLAYVAREWDEVRIEG